MIWLWGDIYVVEIKIQILICIAYIFHLSIDAICPSSASQSASIVGGLDVSIVIAFLSFVFPRKTSWPLVQNVPSLWITKISFLCEQRYSRVEKHFFFFVVVVRRSTPAKNANARKSKRINSKNAEPSHSKRFVQKMLKMPAPMVRGMRMRMAMAVNANCDKDRSKMVEVETVVAGGGVRRNAEEWKLMGIIRICDKKEEKY